MSRVCPPPQQSHLLCHNVSFSDQSREHADHVAAAPRPLPRGPAPAASPGLESAVSSRCLPSCQHVSCLFKAGPDVPGNMNGQGASCAGAQGARDPLLSWLHVPHRLGLLKSGLGVSACTSSIGNLLPSCWRPTGTWLSCKARGVSCYFLTNCQVFTGPVTFTDGGLGRRNALPSGHKARQAFDGLQSDSAKEGTLLSCRVGGDLQVKAPAREHPGQRHSGPSLRQPPLALQNPSA